MPHLPGLKNAESCDIRLAFIIGVCQYLSNNYERVRTMKVIFTTSGNNLDALLDPSF